MKYRLYSRKEISQGKAKTPDAQFDIELELETENFAEILEFMIDSYKIKNLRGADIRIIDGGCEWHLSNQEIIQEVEKFAEEYSESLRDSLKDKDPVVLECPICEVRFHVPPKIHKAGDKVCGNCSDPNNTTPILQEVDE